MRWQYTIRSGEKVQEQRDRELEDYLEDIALDVDALETDVAVLEAVRAATSYDCDALFGAAATNLTVNRAEYWQVADGWYSVYIDIELSGAPGSGSFSIALPVAPMLDHNTGQCPGGAQVIDQGTARYLYPVTISADDSRAYINTGWGALNYLTHSNVFTFASGDGITMNFTYRGDP